MFLIVAVGWALRGRTTGTAATASWRIGSIDGYPDPTQEYSADQKETEKKNR